MLRSQCYHPPMRTILPAALLLSTSAAALAADHPHAAGECGHYSWNMTREFELLRAAPFVLPALTGADPEARHAPSSSAWTSGCCRRSRVKLHVAPRREPAPDSFAGVLKLRVKAAGTYRVSASQRFWIEVVGPAGAVESSKFAMEAGCEPLRKSVAFPQSSRKRRMPSRGRASMLEARETARLYWHTSKRDRTTSWGLPPPRAPGRRWPSGNARGPLRPGLRGARPDLPAVPHRGRRLRA